MGWLESWGSGRGDGEVRGSPDLLGGGPVAGRSCCEEPANKGPSGRRKGKGEQGSDVVLKCFDPSGVLTPWIAVP